MNEKKSVRRIRYEMRHFKHFTQPIRDGVSVCLCLRTRICRIRVCGFRFRFSKFLFNERPKINIHVFERIAFGTGSAIANENEARASVFVLFWVNT